MNSHYIVTSTVKRIRETYVKEKMKLEEKERDFLKERHFLKAINARTNIAMLESKTIKSQHDGGLCVVSANAKLSTAYSMEKIGDYITALGRPIIQKIEAYKLAKPIDSNRVVLDEVKMDDLSPSGKKLLTIYLVMKAERQAHAYFRLASVLYCDAFGSHSNRCSEEIKRKLLRQVIWINHLSLLRDAEEDRLKQEARYLELIKIALRTFLLNVKQDATADKSVMDMSRHYKKFAFNFAKTMRDCIHKLERPVVVDVERGCVHLKESNTTDKRDAINQANAYHNYAKQLTN